MNMEFMREYYRSYYTNPFDEAIRDSVEYRVKQAIRYVIEDELTEKLGGSKTELYQLFEKFIDAYADEMDVLLEEMYLLGAKDREKMLK